MRTKTLLLAAAALSAGVLASSAQVYSANVVGYINVTCTPGLTMIANQLNNTNNTVDYVMPQSLPADVQLWTWNGTTFDYNTYYGAGNGWDDGSFVFKPGVGAFFKNPFGTNIVITFVGDVIQGTTTNSYVPGLNFMSSIVPQAGNLETDLGLTSLTPNDQVWTWNGTTYDYNTYYGPNDWDAPPTVQVGQSFFLSAQNAGQWVRTFTVN